ncbi:M20/M25/M40 family metallo-hydrolase [Alicyclobacillus mali (ex Roth et al. 2021)]|uniref:M20/M25/M40 family metallo-hydrolase n=1 Tax=Alicyclobacillus mali (ex Roth et al. 2021) TaxID=1123961 RepID=UPI00083311E6|nr:M20/M25/M40 family metallo-hydrolase [Alicyclobacillus mali (ex Roth et al. 2021)]MCL6490020.1 M20/M25/M40 family metallo-hydrolase [Alicyclobacillus mali (ex Roth et al. 2021)]
MPCKPDLWRLVDDAMSEEVAFLQSLVQTPTDNPPGDARSMLEMLKVSLERLGIESVEVDLVEGEEAARYGQVAAGSVVARLSFGGGGPEVVLNAHGDVVPPGLGWTYPPYGGVIDGGYLYGRGAAVSKSDIAVYTFAALAVKRLGAAGCGRVALVFNMDEETGGHLGPRRLLERGAIAPDYALCAGSTYTLGVAHNGCLHLEVRLTGRSAHAAMPHLGADALEAGNALLTRLYRYRDEIGTLRSRVPGIERPTLVVGTCHAGIHTNVVPDACVIRLDRRVIPEEDLDLVEAELRAVIAESVRPFPDVRCEVTQLLRAESLRPLALGTPLHEALERNALAVIGEHLPAEGVPLYTDARHFASFGIPVIMYGAGPRHLADARGHRADERVSLRDLALATRVVAGTLADLLGIACVW